MCTAHDRGCTGLCIEGVDVRWWHFCPSHRQFPPSHGRKARFFTSEINLPEPGNRPITTNNSDTESHCAQGRWECCYPSRSDVGPPSRLEHAHNGDSRTARHPGWEPMFLIKCSKSGRKCTLPPSRFTVGQETPLCTKRPFLLKSQKSLASLVSFAGFWEFWVSGWESGHRSGPKDVSNSETGDVQHGRLLLYMGRPRQ